MSDRRATLVLSGGGAKGAYQVGAERVLREEFGFRWERIFGVSVGALNATLLAQGAYELLRNIWLTIREQDVYRKFPWPVVAVRLALLGKTGIYDDSPLRQFIEQHAGKKPFGVSAHVGRVSLVSGKYELVDSSAPDFLDAVWQSATMPLIWDAIGPSAYVDGGLRNVTPLGDALDFDPTELVVIPCGASRIEPAKAPANILDVAKRSLMDIITNEIMINDVQQFIRINDMVKQAEAVGLVLKKENGEPYRYCRITVLEPSKPLGDTLDFSPESIRARLRHGEDVARATMQRAGALSGEGLAPTVTEPEHPRPV